MDPESRAWVDHLSAQGSVRDEAVARLHGRLLRMARSEASRRAGWHGVRGRELDDLANQAADDATVSILRRLPEFRGDSRFTTWAFAFVVHEVSGKLGRHVWRRDGVHLDEESWEELPARFGTGPEQVSESRALVGALRAAVDTQLTAHQRLVFVALVVNAVPIDALAVELDTNRNALYKTMFDVRRKLRRHLETHGYLDEGGEA